MPTPLIYRRLWHFALQTAFLCYQIIYSRRRASLWVCPTWKWPVLRLMRQWKIQKTSIRKESATHGYGGVYKKTVSVLILSSKSFASPFKVFFSEVYHGHNYGDLETLILPFLSAVCSVCCTEITKVHWLSESSNVAFLLSYAWCLNS